MHWISTKRHLLSLCIAVFSFSPLAHHVLALNQPPSLYAQMELQSEIDRKARISEWKYAVQARYRAKIATRSATVILSERIGVPTNLISQTEVNGDILRPTLRSPHNDIIGVNMEKVRSTWLSWINEVRANSDLPLITYDQRLDLTANAWAMVLRDRDERNASNVHRRSLTDSYYDFGKITQWFEDSWVFARVVNHATTTENVWFWSYNCDTKDCTDAMIAAVRKTFDFFMSEKSYNGVHYRSMVQPNFSKIGFSVQVNTTSNRYYLVVHYITDFEEE